MRIFFLVLITAFLGASTLPAQTIINSNVTSNTTWTAANSPYQVTNSIIITSGVTLTIEPGVTVFADSVSIDVAGSLVSVGNATDSIHFTGTNGSLAGAIPNNWKWFGINVGNGGSLNMAFTTGSLAATFVQFASGTHPMALIRSTSMTENYRGIRDLGAGSMPIQVDSCVFTYCRYPIIGNNMGISYSQFSSFDNGIAATNAFIDHCTFTDNINYSVILDGGQIFNCTFGYTPAATAFNFGIKLTFNSGPGQTTTVNHNDIRSFHGIWIDGTPSGPLTIENNQICTDSVNVMVGTAQAIDLANNCWCTIDSAEIAASIVDPNSFPAPNAPFSPIDSSCVPFPVYPGDANHDQIANMVDLLPIGLHFGTTGPLRPNASLNWVGQAAPAWEDSLLSTGADLKHVDSNGDGIINDDDTLAISLNYLQTHNGFRPGNRGTGIPLYFDMPDASDSLQAGDTISIPVMFGSVDTMGVDVYGLSFSIQYDSSILVQGAAKVNYNNSWLGTKGTDLLSFGRELVDFQQIDLALVRNDQMTASGMGQIAEVIVVIDDDIFKTEALLLLSFSNVYAIDANENVLEVNPQAGSAIIEEIVVVDPTAISSELFQSLKLFPNPAESSVLVSVENQAIQRVSLISPTGQVLQELRSANRTSAEISLSAYSRGLYFIRVETASGVATKKLLIK